MADKEIKYEVRADDSKLDKNLDKVNKQVKKNNSILEAITLNIVKILNSSLLLMGKTIAGVGVTAEKIAFDMDKAMNGFLVSTGKGKEEIERYQNVLEKIYANNYGESFADIADNMSIVIQKMGELSDADLQAVVESGYLLQDVFGIDMETSISGANALIRQFGVDAQTAYNLMAQGAQEGLNQNGELIDQIEGYSAYYADLGFSVADMMNVMANAMESNLFQVDNLNDAIVEFSTRIRDGVDSNRQAFEALGFNADEMFSKFTEGGEGANKAFRQIVEKLLNMDDKIQQGALGETFFGDKWGKVGEAGVGALTDSDGPINSQKNKLAELEKSKYDDLGSIFQALTRSVELLLLPLGKILIPRLQEVFESIMQIVEQALPSFIELINGLFAQVSSIVNDILPDLIDLSKQIVYVFSELKVNIPIIVDAFTQLGKPLFDTAEGGESVEEVFWRLFDALTDVDDKVQNFILGFRVFIDKRKRENEDKESNSVDSEDSTENTNSDLVEFLNELLPSIMDLVVDLLPLLLELFEDLNPTMKTMTDEILPVLVKLFIELLPAVMILLGLYEDLNSTMKTTSDEVLPMLVELFVTLMSPIMSLINELLPQLIDMFILLLDPLIYLIELILPPLLELIQALMPVFASVIEAIRPLIEIFLELIDLVVDILMPIITTLANLFVTVLTSALISIMPIVKSIIDIFGSVIDFIKNVFTGNWRGAWENIKDIFKSIAEGLGASFKAPINFIVGVINGFIRGINKIKLPDWLPGGLAGKGINIPEIPKLKVGMDYVPSDDFPALLHEGEAVLAKKEANLYRALGGINGIEALLSGGSMRQANYRSSMNMEEAPVYVSIAGDIHTHVDLDTKEVGIAVSPIVSRELAVFTRRGR